MPAARPTRAARRDRLQRRHRSTAAPPRSAAAARISRPSILAAALDAEELWIWTDVDGIMTGDPRLVPDARVLDEITYSEAAELAYAGAKVLHPRTLAPLIETPDSRVEQEQLRPDKPGTRIVPKLGREVAGGPHAVTSMANVALVVASSRPAPESAAPS